MQKTAVQMTKEAFGINVFPGTPTEPSGNCTFDSAINGMVQRSSTFNQPTTRSAAEWRQYACFRAQINPCAKGFWSSGEEAWNKGWDQLRRSGVYERPGGDLLLSAIAMVSGLNIMVVNTNHRVPGIPFTFILSNVWGAPGKPSSPSSLQPHPTPTPLLSPLSFGPWWQR